MPKKAMVNSLSGSLFTLTIVIAVLFIASRYLTTLAWAGLITIAIWPLYQRWHDKVCQSRSNLAALSITLLISLIIIIPVCLLIITVLQEAFTAIQTLTQYNSTGIPMPNWIHSIPVIHDKISEFWQQNLAQPRFIQSLALHFHQHTAAITSYLRTIGALTLYHSLNLLMCLLALFFFLRDGITISMTLDRAGQRLLAGRWQHYFDHLPGAIRGVVNGTIIVGLGVGVLMGISYALAGLNFPVLLGLLSGLLAMVPFGIILVLLVICALLALKGSYVTAMIIFFWGTAVNLIADHTIKPALIGGATKLPFLMILIGILGGAEKLGLIGLFIGPIIMVLFYNLLQELTLEVCEKQSA